MTERAGHTNPAGLPVVRFGARDSRLSLRQSQGALHRLAALWPELRMELVPMSSPGDRDRSTDLRVSPPDFFTRDLDEALRAGTLDGAIHSAKDLPSPLPPELDWFWLPWREDPRDALILRLGASPADLPPRPRVGISSDRREAYARARFPGAHCAPLRGDIETRLRHLDTGDFDVLIMAAAALQRLGMEARITEWIDLETLPVPEGQGALAVTFRAGDRRMQRLRACFCKAVLFVGAGAGQADTCTQAGLAALRTADVCLYDALLDPRLLDALPAGVERIAVGKRCGRVGPHQAEITASILRHVRQGQRVVRLKGGDPGVFGRLAEEVEALEALSLPFRVIPGVSSLNEATTGTGMLLTRRGLSRGFCAITPRLRGGGCGSVGAQARAELPIVLFMAVQEAAAITGELCGDGLDPATPAALVFRAGMADEVVVSTTLAGLPDAAQAFIGGAGAGDASGAAVEGSGPGLLIVGAVAGCRYASCLGALAGTRLLLTCGAVLQERAALLTRDLGGRPLGLPLIGLTLEPDAGEVLRKPGRHDWIALTSPSAVAMFSTLLRAGRVDVRRLPRLMVCGPGTALALEETLAVTPDLQPAADFGVAGLLQAAQGRVQPGERVLRLHSDRAGAGLATGLRALGALVEDVVLYRHTPVVTPPTPPPFDAVLFASGSAVEAFVGRWGTAMLNGKALLAIGEPTATVLRRQGLTPEPLAAEATLEGCLTGYARRRVAAGWLADVRTE